LSTVIVSKSFAPLNPDLLLFTPVSNSTFLTYSFCTPKSPRMPPHPSITYTMPFPTLAFEDTTHRLTDDLLNAVHQAGSYSPPTPAYYNIPTRIDNAAQDQLFLPPNSAPSDCISKE
jgi:hypothetical protein